MSATRKTSVRAVSSTTAIYRLRIELLGVRPKVWRRLLVPSSIKLSQLHVALLWSMGWLGGHLHAFDIGHYEYGELDPDFPNPSLRSDDRHTLARALGALRTFTYFYDFGDGWEHRVTVEEILPPNAALSLPLCLAGANACPPEDVGGPHGYKDFLEAIRDPSHEEHKQLLEWCGGQFDPKAFSVEDVNESLGQFRL